jgi:hypothetical protein
MTGIRFLNGVNNLLKTINQPRIISNMERNLQILLNSGEPIFWGLCRGGREQNTKKVLL